MAHQSRRIRRALALLCLAGAARAQGKAHSVRGTILNGATRAPLSGALVQIQNAATSASARSDADGLVRLSLSAGAYQLIVRRIGYDPIEKQIVLADSSSEFTVALQPQPQRL